MSLFGGFLGVWSYHKIESSKKSLEESYDDSFTLENSSWEHNLWRWTMIFHLKLGRCLASDFPGCFSTTSPYRKMCPEVVTVRKFPSSTAKLFTTNFNGSRRWGNHRISGEKPCSACAPTNFWFAPCWRFPYPSTEEYFPAKSWCISCKPCFGIKWDVIWKNSWLLYLPSPSSI